MFWCLLSRHKKLKKKLIDKGKNKKLNALSTHLWVTYLTDIKYSRRCVVAQSTTRHRPKCQVSDRDKSVITAIILEHLHFTLIVPKLRIIVVLYFKSGNVRQASRVLLGIMLFLSFALGNTFICVCSVRYIVYVSKDL